MGFISALLGGGSDDRTPEERRVDVLQHKAYKDAGNARPGCCPTVTPSSTNC